MPASTPIGQVIFIGALGTAAALAVLVYPFVSVMRATRAKPRVFRWTWALATLVPGFVCMALAHGQEFIGLVVNWLVWLVFLWRARALAWRRPRRWATPALAIVAVLLTASVGYGLWKQHDSTGSAPLARAAAASS